MWQVIATVSILIAGSADPPRSFDIANAHKFADEQACTLYMLSIEFRETIGPLMEQFEEHMAGHPGKIMLDLNCKQEGEPA